MHDLLAFPDSSRVWIFQADRQLPEDEIGQANAQIYAFTQQWTSHNHLLRATGGLLHDLFVILVADESRAGASGCSIDTSVHFIRELGARYDVDFFDRLHFAYLKDDHVHRLHRDALAGALQRDEISDQTLFFDNLVKDKETFLKRWVTPFGESWMRRFA